MSHRVAVIRQVTNALRKTFDGTFPETDLFPNQIYTGPNFQYERQNYPAIYVAYQEQEIKNIGLGHRIRAVDDQGLDRILSQAIASGAIQFTVMALTPLERDTLMDALSDVLVFGKNNQSHKAIFWKEINDADFLWLTINTESIQPGGVSNATTPWNAEDELLFTGSYMVTSSAEFYSDFDTSEFVPINKVTILPYREDQQVPTGADDPAPWN
jgi:hypothetical protein